MCIRDRKKGESFVNENEIKELSQYADKNVNILTAISNFRTDLQQESDERRAADKETMDYTKKANNKNLTVAIIGVIIAFASLLVAFFK